MYYRKSSILLVFCAVCSLASPASAGLVDDLAKAAARGAINGLYQDHRRYELESCRLDVTIEPARQALRAQATLHLRSTVPVLKKVRFLLNPAAQVKAASQNGTSCSLSWGLSIMVEIVEITLAEPLKAGGALSSYSTMAA